MSLGVAMDMGTINPYWTYANYQISTNTGAAGAKDAGVKESVGYESWYDRCYG